MTTRIGKYLVARLRPRVGGRVTDRWTIEGNDGSALGSVQWFGRWRQYTFDPAVSTTFNRDCLVDIAAFLGSVNQARAAKGAPS